MNTRSAWTRIALNLILTVLPELLNSALSTKTGKVISIHQLTISKIILFLSVKVSLKTGSSADLFVLLTMKASVKLDTGNPTTPQKNGQFQSQDHTENLHTIIRTDHLKQKKACTSETIYNGTTSSVNSRFLLTMKIMIKKNFERKFKMFRRKDEIIIIYQRIKE
jgi:hypothetical protein